jgi:hypothetical protein
MENSTTTINQTQPLRNWKAIILALTTTIILTIILMGCSSNQVSKAAPTSTTRSTLASDTPRPTATVTPQPPTRTETSTPTNTPTQIPTNTSEPTFTPTATLLPSPFVLSAADMKANNFLYLTTNTCIQPDMACWEGQWGEKSLITTKSIYIDPNWMNPYLNFWHTYKIDLPGTNISVQISGDDQWFPIHYYSEGVMGWLLESIPLRDFKGEEISIRFYAPSDIKDKLTWHVIIGGRLKEKTTKFVYTTDWSIQGIQIVPNFQADKK